MDTRSDSRLLRRALTGNAVFSTLCGVTLLAAGGLLGPVLAVPPLALRIVGLTLLPFAFGLWQNAHRVAVHRGEAWLAVGLDLAWVAGSALLVFGDLWPLSYAGIWAVLGVAEVVLVCAALQGLGLVRGAPRTVPQS